MALTASAEMRKVRKSMGAVLDLKDSVDEDALAWKLLHNAHSALSLAHSLLFAATEASRLATKED